MAWAGAELARRGARRGVLVVLLPRLRSSRPLQARGDGPDHPARHDFRGPGAAFEMPELRRVSRNCVFVRDDLSGTGLTGPVGAGTIMNFASDNTVGVAPEIMDAMLAANKGAAMPYGADAISQRLEARFA